MSLSKRFLVATLIVWVAASGCARSPEAKKARALTRADKYFSQQQYREAIVEYRNVLSIDSSHARAIQQSGLAHYALGEAAQAFSFLLRTKELAPDNLDARVKLGTIYLLGGKPEEARQEASAVLSKEPKNFDAHLLVAGAARTPSEVQSAIQRLEQARSEFGSRAKFHIALATLYARKQDQKRAESTLKEAVATEPKSIEAHTALGEFYFSTRDFSQAEQEFKAAADLAPLESPARMRLAEIYLGLGKREEAKRILGEVTEKAPRYVPAWLRTAEIALAEHKYDETVKALDVILKRNPSHLDARLLRGRVHLEKREATEAIQEFQKALKLEPRSPQTHYQLAVAHLQAGNLKQARVELKEATTIEPNFHEAILRLAELDMQSRAYQPAIEALEHLVAKHRSDIRAYVLLGSAYLAKRDPVKATETYRKIVTLAPKDPIGPYFVGIGLRAQGKLVEAKKEFEASLALAPGYVDPVTQLVAIALAQEQSDLALQRVKKQIAIVQNSAGMYHLLGDVHRARKETGPAEAAYLKALDLDHRLSASYSALAKLYRASGKDDQALEKLDEALRINQKDVVARMLSGMIYEQRGEIPKAQKAYETVLQSNPRFPLAANNLAYLYSEYGGDKEKALELAQIAKEAAPQNPYFTDTLGWILYKRGIYQRALALLQESASKLSDNPEVQYHLGTAYLKVGDKENAKSALNRAVSAREGFRDKEEARKMLAGLK